MKSDISRTRRALLGAGAGAALLAAGYAGRHRILGDASPLQAFHGLAMGSTYSVRLFSRLLICRRVNGTPIRAILAMPC